ncbi:MAG: GGDEF domain-containing protein [Actinomycetota bacterium]|nr:GGDEF domain-containing protein [Actinomycetota bacterium]
MWSAVAVARSRTVAGAGACPPARHVAEGPAIPAPAPPPAGEQDRSRLAELHESIATMLASRGEWQRAYQHLRSALDLRAEDREPVRVPEQLHREVDRLRREHAEAREQSLRDTLTASYNRRYLYQRLGDLTGDPGGLALALVDLDCFKHVNDTHGHLLGDRVLQRVVEVLCDGLPAGAFCVRYGGEEFVLVLPDVAPATAVVICEAARARIEQYPWDVLVPDLRVTVSIGVTQQGRGPGGDRDGETGAAHPVHVMLNRADELLYAAKQSGRNAVAYRSAGVLTLAGAARRRRF